MTLIVWWFEPIILDVSIADFDSSASPWYGSYKFSKATVNVSSSDNSCAAIVETINKSSYRKAFLDNKDAIAKLDIGAIENALDKFLLKESTLLLHQNPLTVSVILGFMYAKEIEVKNLRMLVKGKQLGLEEEFIEQQLVI